jgi:hypothetical protein
MLFGLGVMFGAVADRIWTGRGTTPAKASQLTVEAMAEALALDSLAERRVRVVLDSLEPNLAQAAAQGSDSLQAVALQARRQLEETLPADRREQFRSWMGQHRRRMMEMMQQGMHNRERDGAPEAGPGMMADTTRGTMHRMMRR